MTSKFISLNSRDFSKRFQDYLIYNLHLTSDVFCLQETQISDPDVFRAFASAWRGPCFWSPAIGKQAGVLVCFYDSFTGSVKNWKRDTSGRIISLLLDLAGTKINLVNIYAPTILTDRKIFFENLHEYFLPSDTRIVAGDFNCYDNQLDIFRGNFVLLTNYLSDFRSLFSLSDAWCRLHPRLCQCTWFNSNFSIGSCLDKFFVPTRFMSSFISCDITPCVFSDHDFVSLSFQATGNISRGPGLWKFNFSLLSNNAFSEYISNSINYLGGCL